MHCLAWLKQERCDESKREIVFWPEGERVNDLFVRCCLREHVFGASFRSLKTAEVTYSPHGANGGGVLQTATSPGSQKANRQPFLLTLIFES